MSKHRYSSNRPSSRQPDPLDPSPQDSKAQPAKAERITGRLTPKFYAISIAVLCALSACLYSWTADFPWVYDDYYYMKDNPLFLEARALPHLTSPVEFAAKPLQDKIDPDLATNILLRPVAYATLHLNHYLDDFNPRWYRAVNILVHAVNGFLIFALLVRLMAHSVLAEKVTTRSVQFIAGTAALLFTAHPLATESVTYVVQRFTSLSTFFYLLTLLLYFHSLSDSAPKVKMLLRGAATFVLLLGMLTKEDVFTAPFLAVLLDKWLFGTEWRTSIKRAVPLLCLLPVIPCLVVMVSWAQSNGSWSFSDAVHVVNAKEDPWHYATYLITQVTVVADYLRQIFWPSDLNLSPDWPVFHSLLQGPVMVSLLVLTATIVLTRHLHTRRNPDFRHSIAFAFTIWFFISLIPSSGLVPLPDMKADHRSYLPSIGIFVAFACLLDQVRTLRRGIVPWRIVTPAVATFAVIALSVSTLQRNSVWRTNKGIWEDTLAKSPNRYSAWSNLGAAYSDEGDFENAAKCFKKAVAIEPRFFCAQQNLSVALVHMKKWEECLNTTLNFVKSNDFAARSPTLIYNIGLSHAGLGRLNKAAEVLNNLLVTYPDHFYANKILGMIYHHQNKKAMALRQLRIANRLHAGDTDVDRLLSELTADSRITASNP